MPAQRGALTPDRAEGVSASTPRARTRMRAPHPGLVPTCRACVELLSQFLIGLLVGLQALLLPPLCLLLRVVEPRLAIAELAVERVRHRLGWDSL